MDSIGFQGQHLSCACLLEIRSIKRDIHTMIQPTYYTMIQLVCPTICSVETVATPFVVGIICCIRRDGNIKGMGIATYIKGHISLKALLIGELGQVDPCDPIGWHCQFVRRLPVSLNKAGVFVHIAGDTISESMGSTIII